MRKVCVTYPPVVLQQILEVIVTPLSRLVSPGALKAGCECVVPLALEGARAAGAGPGVGGLLVRGGAGAGGAGAVGLAESVTAHT